MIKYNDKTTGLETNNHSVFKLRYHLILVIKYRREVITDKIMQRLVEIFDNIGKEYKINVIKAEHNKDHVHILMCAEPKSNISKFINAYKSASSRRIKKEFPEVTRFLWNKYFWTQSFCLLTVGENNIEIVEKYIDEQRKK